LARSDAQLRYHGDRPISKKADPMSTLFDPLDAGALAARFPTSGAQRCADYPSWS